jgi:microcystin-dependent protein
MRLSRIVLPLLLGFSALPAHAADLWRSEGAPSFVNQNGKPYASGKLCYYEAGTTDALTVFKTADEAEAWAQPIELSSAGTLGDPIYVPIGAFKEVFLTSDAEDCDTGTVLFTSDDIPGALNAADLGIDTTPERPILAKAGNYTLVAADIGKVVDVDATADHTTITLIGVLNGEMVTVRKNDASANTVIVDTIGTETINGTSTYTLTKQNETVTVVSDGSSWRTIDTDVAGTITFAKLATDAWDDDPTLGADSDALLPTQAAVKDYVDAVAVASIKWKAPVRVATTANGTLASDFEDGDEIDGVTLATGDRILIKNQTTETENGIYTVEATGAPTRAADANEDAEVPGSTVLVEEGTANGNQTWANNNTSVEIGTDNITFVQTAGSNVYTADNATLELNGSQFRIKNLGATTAKINDLAVTEGKIASSAVTYDKLAADVQKRTIQVGTIFDYVGATCPAYSVSPFGQAISRETYSVLFGITSTTYGAGNGTTTFNVPDIRGRVVAGDDDMGGTSANRLTDLTDGVNGDTLGAVGGVESFTLALGNLPSTNLSSANLSVTGSISLTGSASFANIARNVSVNTAGVSQGGSARVTSINQNQFDLGITSNLDVGGSIPLGGSGTAKGHIQPTIVLTKCLQTGV